MKKNSEKRNDWIPDRLGSFKILEKLGHGGMGDVYKAVQEPLNRTVALKVLSPQLGRNEEFSSRFEVEAKAISLLEHQNIVTIYQYGEEQGLKYFAMQFVEGENLGDKINGKKPLPLSDIVDYSKQICRALRYAHEKNVIHRDIKPQNVLIDKNNLCKLSDFGIAKIYESNNITMTGMAVGTPEYMSPEQAEGNELTAQTDIYSLGIVIYELLTKRPPFSGNNPVAIAYKQVHEIPLPPSSLRKDTPKRLELIVLKALKKKRSDRYNSIEEMLKDLDTVNIDEKVDRPTVSFAKLKSRPTLTDSKQQEKRITDRRSGDRRFTGQWDTVSPLKLGFWKNLWKTQGISLILIFILSIILGYHILFQH